MRNDIDLVTSVISTSLTFFLCSDAGALSTCKSFDTNNEEAAWEDMDVSIPTF